MDSVTRVLTALKCEKPDKVPFVFGYIDKSIREKLLGGPVNYGYDYKHGDWAPDFAPGEATYLEPYQCTDERCARMLGLDALGFQYMTPVFAEVDKTPEGVWYIRKPLLTTPEDLEKAKLPDVDDERIYEPGREFVRRYKGEFALYCRIRLGISPVLNSMGVDNFSLAAYDDPDFVKETVRFFTEWVGRHIRNLMEIGFDFIWSFDDMAFKSGPLFSNAMLREFFLPYLKAAADNITVPWLFHSDGNLMPVLDDLCTLGMSGIHPLEPGAMDLRELKAKYGRRLCLVGNIDIDHTMTFATPEEIDACVREKMEILGPDGGFIISDSNSMPAGVRPENIVEIARCVEKHRYIY